MARFLFNAIQSVTEEGQGLLTEYGEKAIAAIVAIVRTNYERTISRGLTGINLDMVNRLVSELRDERQRIADDYSHGMLGDSPLSRDPIVSVTSNIVNSPGAITQSGVGVLSQTVHQQEIAPFIASLDNFLANKEVHQLDANRQDALRDVVDVLRAEAQKNPPDPGKLKRWGTRLLELASDFGVQASAGAVGTILAKLVGF